MITDAVSRRTFLAAAGAAGAAFLAADPGLVQAALDHARAQVALPIPLRFESLTATESPQPVTAGTAGLRVGEEP